MLVTGGAGFIGSHIADALISRGHNVTIIDDLSTGSLKNVNPGAKFLKMDIRDKSLSDLFAQSNFNIIIHHAAQMDVRKSVEDPEFDASVNILGSINLLENCVRFKVEKFIFASTGGAIYGEQKYFPADESHPINPLSPYGIAKYSVEKYLFYYNTIHNLKYISLRYGNVYGPRQNPHGEAGVIAIFTEKMLAGSEPLINGDGKQTRDYVYVEDVVKANILALEYNKSGVFNVGTTIETDVNQIFHILKELTGSSCEEHHGPPKIGEQRRSVLDYSLIKRSLGWEPSVNLYEGLKKTVAHFKRR